MTATNFVRSVAQLLGAGGAAVLLLSCNGDSLAFPTQPIACSISPPTLITGTAPRLSAADVQLALQDLVTRVVPSFPAGPERTELATRLSALSDGAQAGTLAGCLGVESARRALAAIAATPDNASDRAVVELTIDVVAASMTSVTP